MKVAWVSHQWPRDDETADPRPGLLPGRWAGGAEFLQEQMRLAAPDGVSFLEARPGSEDLLDVCHDADRIVVASPESLSDGELSDLSGLLPAVVWMMTVQKRRISPLLETAAHVVWASDQMRTWHPWAPLGTVISGYFPTDPIVSRKRRNGRALWAARDHPLKGRMNARVWALDRRLPLDELTDAPREAVLEAMSRASVFVHRPLERDPCPTTVVEAQIAGCEIAVNANVGRIPASSRDEAVNYVESLPSRFYELL